MCGKCLFARIAYFVLGGEEEEPLSERGLGIGIVSAGAVTARKKRTADAMEGRIFWGGEYSPSKNEFRT
ncbi:hypothetical protein FRC15_000391 [Serendipita sp. 397]|nr:hypothetical protein FRC15_000391 [Serendipita sp. 397]KAG8785678.1 hypothetical protein FRC16_001902 [Serendipita sp. 398]